jgi:flagellar hook-associated protein 2
MVSAVSGTNIDVNTLVGQLMTAERTPLAANQKVASGYNAQISAFGQLSSSLSGLGDALARLDSTDAFRATSASVSDPTVLGATAATGAAKGSYNIEVQSLAQAQKLSSDTFASSTTTVGTGTLSIQLGTWDGTAGSFTANSAKATLNLTIDSSNNTLAGIRDAINGANAGVRASIINDGSGARLALSSVDGGTANSIKVTTVDGDGTPTDTNGLSKLAYDPAAAAGAGRNLAQNVAAKDALLYIDGVKVVKSSNTISDAIDGVTLNLAKTNTGQTTTVTVAPDAAAMKATINSFVTAYNSFNSTVKSLTYYDATNKTSGALQGDATARGLVSQVRSLITGNVSGLGGTLKLLPQIGLSLQTDGSLALDGTKFQAAVDAHAGDLAALFGSTGTTTDNRVSFSGASTTTATGTFNVAITQAATRGSLTGAGAAGLTITTGTNDSLSVSIDGVAADITLTAGTYANADALAAEVQSRLAGNSALKAAGISATVGNSGGVLSITSNGYGSGSTVGGASGSAAAALFGGTPSGSAGLDVAGTINGVAATGVGRSLASADGLRLDVSATAPGALGSVTFTRGYGALLHNAVTNLSASTGPISARTDGLNASVKRNTKEQDDFNARMTVLEANYRRQFTALDTMLSSFNTTSTFLTNQVNAYNKA